MIESEPAAVEIVERNIPFDFSFTLLLLGCKDSGCCLRGQFIFFIDIPNMIINGVNVLFEKLRNEPLIYPAEFSVIFPFSLSIGISKMMES